MAKRVDALINPAVLKWARESHGLDIQTAAKKVGVRPERVESWETGDARPTVPQLRKVAHVLRRPIAVFYLPQPPADVKAPHDFRRLPSAMGSTESPELRYEIRRATFRREMALDLVEAEGEHLPEFEATASAEEDPELVAARLREYLRVDAGESFTWRGPYESFNQWRGLVEGAGALVLQMIDVPLSEARGFSISEFPLPVVVVNIKDAPRGRTFSLLHELTHVMLHQDALCDLDDTGTGTADDLAVERFCNAVAGAALIPRGALLDDRVVVSHGQDPQWSDEELEELSRRFAASREAVLRRLLDLSKTTLSFYRERRIQFLDEYERAQRAREAGFAPPHQIALASAGPSFAGLVLSGYSHGHITGSDVSDLLGIRLKHLPRLQQQLLSSERRR